MSAWSVLSVVSRGLRSRLLLDHIGVTIPKMTASHGFMLPRCCLGCAFLSNDHKIVSTKTSEVVIKESPLEYVPPDSSFKRRRNLQCRALILSLQFKEMRMRRLKATQRSLRRKRDAFMKTLTEAEIIKHENVYTIPNFLCIARIIACPYLGYIILQEQYGIACSLFVLAGVTDFLDGFIARHYPGQASKLGSFLDPLADKVLVATVFLTLTYNSVIPGPLTAIIVARDVLLVGAGFYIRYRSLPPPKTISRYFDASFATAQLAPTQISKVNTFVQLGMIVFTLSAPVFGYLEHPFLTYLWWLTGATTILSAGSYVFSSNTYRMLKQARAGGTKPSIIRRRGRRYGEPL